MKYRLEFLSPDAFEEMVNTICQKILGTGVISFSKGKDGGKDGKFTGTANNFPSDSDNWSGKFIIQAKHTENPIASCSDSNFEKKIIPEEIEKLKKLKANGDLDNYLLFTNRKFTGVKGESLTKKIRTEVGIDNVEIIGIETINSYLSSNKNIVNQYGLNKYSIPFDFSDEEIKQLIIEFKKQLPDIEDDIKEEVARVKYDYEKISIALKNEKNQLGETYYTEVILSNSLQYFDKIDTFLENPINKDLKDYYFDIVDELRDLIIVKREDFGAFEKIFVFIYKSVCESNDSRLKGKKRYVNTFLHYMYHTCSIGLK